MGHFQFAKHLIHSGLLFFEDHNSPYNLLRYLEPGLCLDVGAAEGRTAVRMANASPESTVLAFEPFDGNIPHFKKMTAPAKNISLIEKAVSDFDGTGRLFVTSTLTGTEKGWEGREGYSSSGTLIGPNHPNYNDARSGDVPTCSIDSTIHERVRFMKVDVQGGEMGVLRGALKTIDQHMIDLIFIEYEGDARIIEFLIAKDYVLFDTGQYVYSQKPGGPEPVFLSQDFKASKVASGRQVAQGPIQDRPMHAKGYIDYFDRLGHLALHTDLLAVRREFMPELLRAASQLIQDYR